MGRKKQTNLGDDNEGGGGWKGWKLKEKEMTGKGRRMEELGRGLEGGEKVGGGGGVGSGGRKEEEGGVENFEMRLLAPLL